MNNTVISLIRTYVPIAVGWLLTLVFENTGLIIDDDSKVTLTALCVAVLSALYYTLVRVAEKKFPQIGWLLGQPAQPKYVEK